MCESLSVGCAALVTRQHSAIAVAQPPLGEKLELVRRAVGVEALVEGLESGVVARLQCPPQLATEIQPLLTSCVRRARTAVVQPKGMSAWAAVSGGWRKRGTWLG